MKPNYLRLLILNAFAVLLLVTTTIAYAKSSGLVGEASSGQVTDNAFPARPYSPYADRKFPMQVFWGDTHLHTSYSMDAGLFGARLGPRDAYRFARGDELVTSTGQRAKLSRPLDFLVVADHSDGLGFFPRLYGGDPKLLADETGRRWYNWIQAGGQQAVRAAVELIDMYSKGTLPETLIPQPGSVPFRNAWDEIIAAAEAANDPGKFTAFIGYEWTSQIPPGDNLHRVVIYRDGAIRAGMMEPYTTEAPGSPNPRDLWKWMQSYENKTGGQVLAIPHNGNLSNGIMFPLAKSYDGKKVDRKYAEKRIRWEPVYEATQIKGDGETHPFLSPDDDFADYETWDKGNLNLSAPKKKDMLQYEYARSALQIGLQIEKRVGVNPYKFGMIGATDSHTALATADEDNFFGKHSGAEPGPGRLDHPMAKIGDLEIEGWSMVSSGYAGVWATGNTRKAIFDALLRKEVYATTGPRIIVRFFGGWDFVPADAASRSPAVIGYSKGVSMGGDLSNAPQGKSPTFLVAALKDPLSGNLDRIQIVKGWIDAEGRRHEKVYNVAWGDADKRKLSANGKLTPVGNTVDVEKAIWTNTIGDSELITVWTDPDFDPALRAVYYTRVLEIPTPRWTAYDAKYYGLTPGKEIPMTTQERAYTSPIWYTP